MAIHSSILAWRIPGTEEPGGLRSMGLQSDRTERLTFSLTSWTLRETQSEKVHRVAKFNYFKSSAH